MYVFATGNEVYKYRSYCSSILTELRDVLFEYDINVQFILVGSGGRNMVTRNGNGPFDLDFNMRIIYMPDEYWDNPGKLKDRVIAELNRIVHGSWFSDGKDSTSVITSLIHNSQTGVEFNFDIAIIAENEDGTLCRLIHQKNYWPTRYIWNEVPNSKNVKAKADELKKNHLWSEVRDRYLDYKNLYLERRDTDHPSFICYIQAVNDAYNAMKSRKKKN